MDMDEKSRPQKVLLAGVEILDGVLRPHGFAFALEHHAKGSGGWFASGVYKKRDRRIELHFRQTLGMVTYSIESDQLDHETYMRLLGVYGRNQYPDVPQEPLDSFRRLASDIESYCVDFVAGDGAQFRMLARQHALHPKAFQGVP
jgi:hypothetical protein